MEHQLHRPDPAHHVENLDTQMQHLVHHQDLVHHDQTSEDEGFPLPLYRRPEPEHSFGHKTNPHQMEDESYYDPRDYNPGMGFIRNLFAYGLISLYKSSQSSQITFEAFPWVLDLFFFARIILQILIGKVHKTTFFWGGGGGWGKKTL